MKKLLVHIIMIFSIITVFSTVAFAQQQPISVIVNDKKIDFPDAKPFVDSNNRTQTPARFIAESLGATAAWDGQEKKATFTSGNEVLILYIGDVNYTINGKVKQMDTTALLKDGRTYVPAKYVAEAFGANVNWKSESRTVSVSTKSSNNTSSEISTTDDNNTATGNPTNVQEQINTKLSYVNKDNKIYFLLKDIKLVNGDNKTTKNFTEVYDTESSKYTITLPETIGAHITEEVLNINDSLVSTVEIIRDKETRDTHIVINAKKEYKFYIEYNEKLNQSEINLIKPVRVSKLSYENKFDRVYFSFSGIKLASVGSTVTNYFTQSYDAENNKYTIILLPSSKISLLEETMSFDDSLVSSVEICRDNETNDTHIIFKTKKEFKFYISYNEKLNQSEINLLTPAKEGETLVVIDAGHGGIDPGACKGTAYEKDINLQIALNLEKLLEAKNINVFMLRQDDTFVGLYDRPYIANALNATLFLCIHNNSIDSTKVSGTETLYYPENEGDTSFTGEKFARLVQDSLISKLNTVNRKTIERPGLVVLRHTKMPAALSEIGFLTNPTDLKNLLSEAFQQKTAEALCDAIVKSLEQLELEE